MCLDNTQWSAGEENAFFPIQEVKKLERMRKRYEDLEALHTQVSRFVSQSSLLVGADKIREVLARLEGSNDLK